MSAKKYSDELFSKALIDYGMRKASHERSKEIVEKVGQASWIGFGAQFFVLSHQLYGNECRSVYGWTVLAMALLLFVGLWSGRSARKIRYELVKIDRVGKALEAKQDSVKMLWIEKPLNK